MVGMWITASFFFVASWVLLLNYQQSADRLHGFFARLIPWSGTAPATPRTLRAVAAGWIILGTLLVLPDFLGLS